MHIDMMDDGDDFATGVCSQPCHYLIELAHPVKQIAFDV